MVSIIFETAVPPLMLPVPTALAPQHNVHWDSEREHVYVKIVQPYKQLLSTLARVAVIGTVQQVPF
jgi:hypothetical protein